MVIFFFTKITAQTPKYKDDKGGVFREASSRQQTTQTLQMDYLPLIVDWWPHSWYQSEMDMITSSSEFFLAFSMMMPDQSIREGAYIVVIQRS